MALVRVSERFTVEEFALAWLGLSYQAEMRMVEGSKIQALLQAEKIYYLALSEQILLEQNIEHLGETYVRPSLPESARRTLENRLAKSRKRERLRWPKYMLTFENRLEYLLAKLERHQGIRLELSARERKFPLLFAWGKYRALKRKGVVK